MTDSDESSSEDVVSPFWQGFIGFFVDNKLVVFLSVAMLIFGGLLASPFDWDIGMERYPIPVDAIPDIGENQQIVFTLWNGRSPRDVEDQITYPMTTALLGIPGVRTVRSASAFGFSSIYVIFEEGVDFYWSRSRVLEKLASLPAGTLPDGVSPTLGPDATALGQVFWYTLEGRDPDGNVVGGWELHELRSVQDWIVRYALQGVAGVSEVASVGGYVREYQVDVDPEAMLANNVSLAQVARAVQQSNLDVGARTMEINRTEYFVRGLGFIVNVEDLEQAVVVSRAHTPIRVSDVARVALGPAGRRGALDDAGAEAVGGVVVMRYGDNPMAVIDRVKEKIERIAPGLPQRTLEDGTVSRITVVPFYDRTELIDETLATLSSALLEEILITILVVLVMLRNLRTSMLISMLLPLAVLLTFGVMKLTGVDANVMALAGIAIAIGVMVDMGIVFTENIVKHLDEAPSGANRAKVVRLAAAEVAPAVLTSVLTTVVSFVPIFALTAAEGKLFKPLAFTKTFAMLGALLLAMVVLPAVAHLVLKPERADVQRRRETTGIRQILAVSWRLLGEWWLLLAGIALATWLWWAGMVLIVARLFAEAQRRAPERYKPWVHRSEIGLASLVVAGVIATHWMPLGTDVGIVLNVTFVFAIVGGILGGFVGFQHAYPAMLRWSLDHKVAALSAPAFLSVLGFVAWLGFGSVFNFMPDVVKRNPPFTTVAHTFPGFGREFMPPFDEGAFLYMPTTMPHASFGQALEMLRDLDAAVEAIPEVDRVVGKLGRVESPLDPAPVSMFETVITYHPEYHTEPDGTRVRRWRDHIRSTDDIWKEITRAARMPGLTSAPVLMPIAARIVMLQTGMRAPMGIKVYGPTLEIIEEFGIRLEQILKEVPTVRSETVFADRVVGKPYIEIEIDREAIGRYGLTIREVQDVFQVALGGRMLTLTVEGRERYPVRVRYMREERDSIEALSRVLVPSPTGEQIPLEQLARIRYVRGPQVIKAEDTFLTSYVLFDRVAEVAEVDVVEQAEASITRAIDSGELVVPPGVSYRFSGSYENQLRSMAKLRVLIPIALATVFLLIYLQFRSVSTTTIIYSGVVLCVAGGFLLIWLYAQPWFLPQDEGTFFGLSRLLHDLFQIGPVNMSVAVWVGTIALVGIATDASVVLATYLSQRFRSHPPKTVTEVRENALFAGIRRSRACLMTTATTLLALLPVVASQGKGSDIMVPMALPSLGGMVMVLITLITVPVLYAWVEERKLARESDATPPEASA